MLLLPTELIVPIILCLPLRDIVSCTQLCKYIRSIIKDTPLIKYEIELQRTGYVDSGNLDILVPERLQRLTVLERAWADLAFRKLAGFTIHNPGSIYEFAGGVFITLFDDGRRLQAIQLPSLETGLPSKQWILEDLHLDRRLRDLTVNPCDDLLVLVEDRILPTLQTPSPPFRIHLRCLSNNLPHPMATLPVLSFTPQDTDSMYGFCLSVSGDTVAVMFSAAHAEVETLPGPGQLVFWNWKTGQLLSVLEGPFGYPSSFTFVTPRIVMVPLARTISSPTTCIQPSLAYYRIPAVSSPSECTLIGYLHLPCLYPGITSVSIYSRSDPTPQDGKSINVSERLDAFHPVHHSRVNAVTLQVVSQKKTVLRRTIPANYEYTIFVHSKVAFDLFGEDFTDYSRALSNTGKEVAWSAWSKYARWTTLKAQQGFVVYSHGTRFVDLEIGPYSNNLHIWDFNPYNVDRNDQSWGEAKETTSAGASEGRENAMAKFTDPNRYSGRSVEEATYKSPGSAANAWSLVPVTCSEPTVVKEEKVFLERKVWSSLPYRRVTSRYKFNDLSGVMMDGERIVLVKLSRPDFLHLTVLARDTRRTDASSSPTFTY